MKKITYLFLAICLAMGASSIIVGAQTRESIISYTSQIAVNTDNSVDVTETIVYDSGSESHHGIYRDIYPYSAQNRKMSIDQISVVDENGNPYQYQVSSSGKNLRIKIGDPNQTFTGLKTYIIRYHVTRAVSQLKDLDEIYWDVTGNYWTMPIENVSATVVLPSRINAIQTACYYGPAGSKQSCQLGSGADNAYAFRAPEVLNAKDGLTVAVGFAKGTVFTYTAADEASNWFSVYWTWFLIALLPLLTLIFSLWYWHKRGRDPRGTGTIVPQYDVPENLTPLEVGGIVSEKVSPSQLPAEIIYLATKGYLKIRQLEESFIGLIKSTDYELTKLKDFSDLPNKFDRLLLQSLFRLEKQSVKISDLRNSFYQDTPMIITSALDGLLNKGYYKNLGRMKGLTISRVAKMIIVALVVTWISLLLGDTSSFPVFQINPVPFIIGVILSILVFNIVYRFSPAKTEKGVSLKEYLLGLKSYLQIAEKDRLLFHNAPEKRPEVFEALLPYAMVLGVAKIWAKEFEGIYTTPPSWYSGPNNAVFNAVVFNQAMSSFNSLASSSLSSSPGHSGSGGGGFSGGGGGGGGGGSW